MTLWYNTCFACWIAKATVKVKKVKVTLVQALRLCTGRTAHRGSRGIALPFHDHGTRRGWGVSVTSRPLFNPGKDPVPIVQEAGWAPGLVWTGAENLAPPPSGIRSADRQPVASRYTNWATRPTTKATDVHWKYVIFSAFFTATVVTRACLILRYPTLPVLFI